jgi:hypothetical protein
MSFLVQCDCYSFLRCTFDRPMALTPLASMYCSGIKGYVNDIEVSKRESILSRSNSKKPST